MVINSVAQDVSATEQAQCYPQEDKGGCVGGDEELF